MPQALFFFLNGEYVQYKEKAIQYMKIYWLLYKPNWEPSYQKRSVAFISLSLMEAKHNGTQQDTKVAAAESFRIPLQYCIWQATTLVCLLQKANAQTPLGSLAYMENLKVSTLQF